MHPRTRLSRLATGAALVLLGVAAWLHAKTISSWAAILLRPCVPRIAYAATPPPAKRSSDAPAMQPVRPPQPPRAAAGSAASDAATTPPRWSECRNDLRVVAIAASEPAASLAVIRPGSGARSLLLRPGDPIGTYRLLGIATDRVFLEAATGPCQLRLDANPATLPDSAGAGPSSSEHRGVRRVDEGRVEVDRGLVDRILADPREVGHVRVVPESVGGTPVGIRLHGIRSGDPLDALGLRSGDRLESINGFPMTSAESMLMAYARLRTARTFSIRLNRAGAEVRVEATIR